MNTDIRKQIETALRAFSGSDLRTASIGLLNSLGYRSEKILDLDNTPNAFRAEFDKRDREFRTDKALFERWKSVEFLFQVTDDEVRAGAQGTLFDSGYDPGNYQSYLFFALDLEKNHYTRTNLADITREINLLFDMPAMLLMRHNGALTFSIIDRRLHKKDQGRDVLEKVKLIKDIRYQDPHRAHIEILYDLALQSLMAKHECRDFKQLHQAWRTTLDTNELNKTFYRELADWYFWALDYVEFPADVEKDTATRNATNVIRLLTRLIFCWFLKEKGLIPADLFSERKLAGVLKSLKDDDSTFYQAILQNLFFGTLNQRMNTGDRENRKFTNDREFQGKRKDYGIKNLYRYKELFAIAEEEAVNLFSDIPFMNGGLFDCLDKEDDSGKVIYVDGFTRNARKQPKVPNFLFFSDYRTLDLSDAYGDKKRKKEEVRGLINLLDSYKFTVTENTPIEEEIALDPELLGKVFENLLASYNPETGTTARKQTGSFYTPREIVHYMVDESLIAYLTQALSKGEGSGGERAAISEDQGECGSSPPLEGTEGRLREVFAYTEKAHPFDEEEVEALIDAIDTCKILDPACGSGAFPMGILHKLVFILGKIDPHNERWKQRQITKAEQIPDVSAREIAVGAIEKDFETNDLDYGRKLYLIENCIYGVDIQPIAIQISKLRFFISLICDQRTNNNKAQNRGVRPLPNLETKFVAANTLISLDRAKGQQLPMTDPRLPKLESELAAVRHRHFAAQRRRDKLALQRRDAELREEIASVLAGGGMSGEASHRLAAWDPYDQNTSAPFFDSEWMYGITNGFDVIIGNPPYVRIQTLAGVAPALASYLKANYLAVAKGSYDIYVVFVERGLDLLRSGGELAYILPNKLFNVAYGQGLRTLVTQGRHLDRVVDFRAEQVFPGATNYVCLLFLAQRPVSVCRFLNVANIKDWFETGAGITGQLASEDIGASEWIFVDSNVGKLIEKLDRTGEPLLDLPVAISRGSSSGYDSAFFVDQATMDIEPGALRIPVSARHFGRYNYEQPPTSRIIFPYVQDGGSFCLLAESVFKRKFPKAYRHLLKVKAELQGRKQYSKWYAFSAPRNLALHDSSEILVPLLADSGSFALIPQSSRGRLCPMASGGFTLTLRDTTPVCARYLLGLLNSKLLFWRLRLMSNVFRGGWITCTKQYFGQLPIALPKSGSHQKRDTIVKLVEQCLAARAENANADTTELERQIDQIVYQLYNLTPGEIAIVEGRGT